MEVIVKLITHTWHDGEKIAIVLYDGKSYIVHGVKRVTSMRATGSEDGYITYKVNIGYLDKE